MTKLPLVLAGPILRRLKTNQLTLWLVTTQHVKLKLELCVEDDPNKQEYAIKPNSDEQQSLELSPNLIYQLINISLPTPLPTDQDIHYNLWLSTNDDTDISWQAITQLLPHLLYDNQNTLKFRIPSQVNSLLHGSCRKPHNESVDGLVVADSYLQNIIEAPSGTSESWPSFLMMSGDQIYADDVSGPMLNAIHQLLKRLNFPLEHWKTSSNSDEHITSTQLYDDLSSYYERSRLLPYSEDNKTLVKVLFGGSKKPIFTSTDADNHLITLGEYLASYLLAWSPTPWEIIDLDMPETLTLKQQERYQSEFKTIEHFKSGLKNVQRVMAHLPVAMIMDDHDVTDDFNLHRHWEETVYNHPLSKKMVGNGLLAYLINQAWGNQPESFSAELMDEIKLALQSLTSEQYESLNNKMIKLEAWDYEWGTSPPLIVLDTRTRRWRSEDSPYKPSGLLDWEAITELQSKLTGHPSVLLVSAAPIFGVKLIEVIQRIVTFFGYPLAVDAEYWMAHPGTASGILNVFRHKNTPQNFVVLSGDVHYSFVYDVELRSKNNPSNIWQICSSGLRNNFPEPLLGTLDKLNRWLYAPKSPLNWFTRRRRMRITPRKPVGIEHGRRLLNHSGIGLVLLDSEGKPTKISQLTGVNQSTEFVERADESIWE